MYLPGVLAVCSTLLFSACEKHRDSLPPQITGLSTEQAEHGDGLFALAGTTAYIKVTAVDDHGLDEMQCRLNALEGLHAHSMNVLQAFRSPNIGTWSSSRALGLEGVEITETVKFSVPATISGVWDLEVAVLDSDGNITYRHAPLFIGNDSIPAILPSATTPAANADGIIELVAGGTLVLEGNILDADYLQTVTARLYAGDQLAWSQEWTPDNVWMFDLSQIVLPPFTASGNYLLILEATDRHLWSNSAQAMLRVN
jgi:hypothetical protein